MPTPRTSARPPFDAGSHPLVSGGLALVLLALGWSACTYEIEIESESLGIRLALGDTAPTTAIVDLRVAGAFRRVPTFVCVISVDAAGPDGELPRDAWVQLDLLRHPDSPALTQAIDVAGWTWGGSLEDAMSQCARHHGAVLELACSVDPCSMRVAVTLLEAANATTPDDGRARSLRVALVARTGTRDPLPGELVVELAELLP